MTGLRGRLTGTEAVGTLVTDVAVTATAVAVATRRAETGVASGVLPDDLRQARRQTKAGNLLIFVVDASGSMGAADRIEAAKGAVLGLLTDAYQRRDRVALISMRGEAADVVLAPTASGEIARTRLVDLPIGGMTPMSHGLAEALRMATAPGNDPGRPPLLVIITDGRATYASDGQDPVTAANVVAAEIARRGIDAVVLDAETGFPRLGLAHELAQTMGATHIRLEHLGAARIEDIVRIHLAHRHESR
jgi:magnesium chelatase subunit D